ncbi:MAG: hypothetical protein IJ188_03065 [Clostridia bacterium]|nr:hypothetical protein [Clostridia bacterium]
MKAELRDITKSMDGKYVVTYTTTEDPREMFDELKDFAVEVKIRKYSEPRSLRANRYAWELIDQITEKMQQKEPWVKWTQKMVYRNAIKEMGGVSQICGMKTLAVDYFRAQWEYGHVGRQVEILDGGMASGKEGWSNVRIWFGSSDFTSAQMAQFINNLIQDAEGLGIPTITPQEEERMVKDWGKRHERAESAQPATA